MVKITLVVGDLVIRQGIIEIRELSEEEEG